MNPCLSDSTHHLVCQKLWLQTALYVYFSYSLPNSWNSQMAEEEFQDTDGIKKDASNLFWAGWLASCFSHDKSCTPPKDSTYSLCWHVSAMRSYFPLFILQWASIWAYYPSCRQKMRTGITGFSSHCSTTSSSIERGYLSIIKRAYTRDGWTCPTVASFSIKRAYTGDGQTCPPVASFSIERGYSSISKRAYTRDGARDCARDSFAIERANTSNSSRPSSS